MQQDSGEGGVRLAFLHKTQRRVEEEQASDDRSFNICAKRELDKGRRLEHPWDGGPELEQKRQRR